jgi:hypothetical protein
VSTSVVSEQRWNVVLYDYESGALRGGQFISVRCRVREAGEELAAPWRALDADTEPPLWLSGERVWVHLREPLTRDHHIAGIDKQRASSRDAFDSIGRSLCRGEPMRRSLTGNLTGHVGAES